MMRLLARLLASVAAAILLASGLVAGPQVAAACACGAVVSDTSVSGETAIIIWNGTRQSIDMVMQLESSTPDAGWIMPTPRGAHVALGKEAAFSLMAEAVAPEVIHKKRWRLGLGRLFGGAGEAGGAPPPGVEVLGSQQVGPFTVTTLAGSDGEAVNGWLLGHGYETRDDLVPAFQEYLSAGWVLQAVKLTPSEEDGAFKGELPPLRLTFGTTEPVYPIKLSAHAELDQSLRLYLVSDQPMRIREQAAPGSPLTLIYSGPVSTSSLDSDLIITEAAQLSAYEGWLQPHDITQEFTFAAAPDMAPFRRQVVVYDDVGEELTVVVILGLLLGAPLLIIALIVRRVTRKPA